MIQRIKPEFQANRKSNQMSYTLQEREKIQKKICRKISQGLSVISICSDNDTISEDTFYRWLKKDAHFSEKYTRARQDQAQYYAEEIIDIADSVPANASKEQIQIANLRMEARKWTAAKLLPKKYGAANQQTNIQLNVNQITGMKIVDDTKTIEAETIPEE